jgi:hypothetical protein
MALAVVTLGTQAATGWMRFVMPAALTTKVEVTVNPTRELLSWAELRQELAARGFLDKPHLFAVAPQWHQAGKVDVQIGDRLPVVCLCSDPRNIAYGWDPRAFVGWDALIIGTDAFIGDVHKAYDAYFHRIDLVDSVDIHLGGRTDVTVRVYFAQNYYRPYPLPVGPGGPIPVASFSSDK